MRFAGTQNVMLNVDLFYYTPDVILQWPNQKRETMRGKQLVQGRYAVACIGVEPTQPSSYKAELLTCTAPCERWQGSPPVGGILQNAPRPNCKSLHLFLFLNIYLFIIKMVDNQRLKWLTQILKEEAHQLVGRQIAAAIEFDPKPSEAVFSTVFSP